MMPRMLSQPPRYVERWVLSDSHGRSIVKAVSWRITGTLDTFVISWIITGTWTLAGAIAATEIVTKIGLYWLHERAWNRVAWGK